MFQGFILDVYRHFHVFKQFRGIDEVHARLLNDGTEHYCRRLIHCPDSNILRLENDWQKKHYY